MLLVTEEQGVINLMGNSSNQLTKRAHLFGIDQRDLRVAKLGQRLCPANRTPAYSQFCLESGG